VSQEWGQLVSNCKGCVITSRFQHKCALVNVVRSRKQMFAKSMCLQPELKNRSHFFHDALTEP